MGEIIIIREVLLTVSLIVSNNTRKLIQMRPLTPKVKFWLHNNNFLNLFHPFLKKHKVEVVEEEVESLLERVSPLICQWFYKATTLQQLTQVSLRRKDRKVMDNRLGSRCNNSSNNNKCKCNKMKRLKITKRFNSRVRTKI